MYLNYFMIKSHFMFEFLYIVNYKKSYTILALVITKKYMRQIPTRQERFFICLWMFCSFHIFDLFLGVKNKFLKIVQVLLVGTYGFTWNVNIVLTP